MDYLTTKAMMEQVTDALYDWACDDLDNRSVLCIVTEGDEVGLVQKGSRLRNMESLIAALIKCPELLQVCKSALTYIEEYEDDKSDE